MTAAAHIAETTRAQRLAADPAISAFVSANAGSGKTRVLTNRVARLLLEDADPSTILCITFTKAAAAEMAERLFKLLGEWALADDAKLGAALGKLDGAERARSARELARARRLFARALETPGGLKIQTIHSFCESVLKRFPLEAGVAPGFTVIEESDAAARAGACVDHVAARARGAVAQGFTHLLSRKNGGALRSLLVECLTARRRRFARARDIGWARLADEAAAALGARADETASALTADLFAALPRDRMEDACAALDASGGNPQKHCAAPLRDYLLAEADDERLAALGRLFFDSKKNPRKKFGTQATEKIGASIEPFLQESLKAFLERIERIRAAEALADTRALYAILEACFTEYADAKAARAELDFDDLIEKTDRLLRSNGGAQWVLYKLDMGLAHILLDEAQDTGPDAWEVIEAPLAEFFAGEGARDIRRTFFAVGDQKQSIYSFQGADAALFAEKEDKLAKAISATQPCEKVPLKASFRTAAPILAFVDALFAREEVVENVSREPLEHFCTREGAAGLVELWPLVARKEPEKPDPWDAPLDATPPNSPAKTLADEVARTIADWLERGEMLESRGRRIAPGDIMILVQSRGALFAEIIRALGGRRVPVAGADKLALLEDQGVLDLVSYARAVLYPGDDLSLAEVLKSPFFNVDEESLFDLAAKRSSARLFDALAGRRNEREEWRRAFEAILAAREVALGGGAVAFFAHILEEGAPSGWRRLEARLGTSCREPIEEFLRQAHEFEAAHPRSLRLFLDAVEKSNAEISRELSEAGSSVRVMTAHKAKGLEADIVFLLDAHRHPPVSKIGDLLSLDGPHGDAIPVLALGAARESGRLAAAREKARRLMREEYRRLLYVAATRARDRLYICGHELGNEKDPGKRPPAEKSWRALAEDAFEALGDRVADAGERFGGRVRRLSSPQTAAPEAQGGESAAAAAADHQFPECLRRAAPAETRKARLSPSQLAGAIGETAPFSPARDAGAFLRGAVLHRLLELLPDVPPPARRRAADRLLAHHALSFGDDERAAMREEALRVLEDPSFADVFSPSSLAEAAIGGTPKGARADILLSGKIDRLAIFPDRILVVDYKTNRPPPARVEDVPMAYLAQMAAYRGLLQEIYPNRKIETALLWTYEARLMALPDEALDEAHRMTLA